MMDSETETAYLNANSLDAQIEEDERRDEERAHGEDEDGDLS